MSQGFLSRFTFGANGMRRLFNGWPPFIGAGIRVREIAPNRKFVVEIVDGEGVTVADVEKTLYIRRKKN